MSNNRFDFLEIGDEKPRNAPAGDTDNAAAKSTWRPQRLRAIEVIGESGNGPGQFSAPRGLAVDRFGALIIADSNNHRIQRIGMNGDLKIYGRPGNAPGELWMPYSVAVEPSGEFLFVAEQGGNRIQCFQANGQHRGVMNGYRAPMGIAFDASARLWVADTGNGRVRCIDIRNGREVGALDRAAGVQRPIALACDKAHNLYITEGVSEDVVRYRNYSLQSGSFGENRRLRAPQQVAVDAEGRLYMAESGHNRLHVFDTQGDSLLTFDTPSTRLGIMREPSGVAIGPNGEIYVADTLNDRVLRLAWE